MRFELKRLRGSELVKYLMQLVLGSVTHIDGYEVRTPIFARGIGVGTVGAK